MLTPQEVSNHAFAKAVMGGYNMAMEIELGATDVGPEEYNSYQFNRLVDVDAITSVSFDGHWFDLTAEQYVPVQLTYLP